MRQVRLLMKFIGAPMRRGIVAGLLLLAAAGLASADGTYTYTGQAYTNYSRLHRYFCAGPVGAAPIALSFTEAVALPDNLTGSI